MNKKAVLTKELFDCDISFLNDVFASSKYPWEILPQIKPLIVELLNEGLSGYKLLKEGVLVGENVSIAETATIIAPAIIGPNTEIRPGAYIRGNVIVGENCVLGNSCEFKNCILLNKVQVPHFSYVGDSILGNKAHLGAGVICSNLKGDGKNVVIHGDEEYETGLRKVGAFVADGADVGCQSVLNPGSVIGKNTRVYPLTLVRGVIPENSIVKDLDRIINKEN